MKELLLLFVHITLCNSQVPKDNHHYTEGDSQYFWAYNARGDEELVDLKTKPDQRLMDAHSTSSWIRFLLLTRQTAGTRPKFIQVQYGRMDKFKKVNFVDEKALYVLIHDWNSHLNSAAMRGISEAALYRADCNVIIVDWKLAAKASYVTAAYTVPKIGEYVASYIQWLVDNKKAHFGLIHIVGFGMGAHIAGMTGRNLGGQVSRVTALDPVGPLFNSKLKEYKVRSNDAMYVEGIHTTFGSTGSDKPVGRADFFPNGGYHPQPRCVTVSCSHNRAFEYFSSTLVYDGITGRKCVTVAEALIKLGCRGKWAKMGTFAYKKSLDGNYQVTTTEKWPFY